ncbi:GDSL-type esterase/lipase family protein [Paenibacillus thalictri]|uniref:SGNH hydrolase-type esterase domain-containing protein n=1 Tax=Paenibacillus thalictri TaxID=2527873 RepID=A0A4Q9DKS9_9BACL|nr:GDSL-type esterase/lipase family protein [Paenibacillus thalictri]TBL73330.1 hypothetical protein EYB31_27010 [Paenibacillus thalictri]
MKWMSAETAGICDWAVRHAEENGTCRLARLPAEWLGRFPGEMARTAVYPTGLEIRFRTDADVLQFAYSFRRAPGAGGQQLAVYTQHAEQEYELRDGEYTELAVKPAGKGLRSVRIVLPWKGELTFHGIGVGSEFQYEPEADDKRPRICFYGDSITQGSYAGSPLSTYPYLVGKMLNVQTVNHGYGGAGFPDPAMAIHLGRDVAWDVLCLAIGTNSYGRGLESGEEYMELFRTFIHTVRRYKPHAPLLCVSPIWRGNSDGRGESNRRGSQLADYRRSIEAAVAELQQSDKHLAILDGMTLIGGPDGLTGDLLHPDDTGMEKIAVGVANCLDRWLHLSGPQYAAEREAGDDGTRSDTNA